MTRRTNDRRPVFILALKPERDVDGFRALRGALKTLKRKFGLVAVDIREVEDRESRRSTNQANAS